MAGRPADAWRNGCVAPRGLRPAILTATVVEIPRAITFGTSTERAKHQAIAHTELVRIRSARMAYLIAHYGTVDREVPLVGLIVEPPNSPEELQRFADLPLLDRVRELELECGWSVVDAARLLGSQRLAGLTSLWIEDSVGFADAAPMFTAAIRPALRTLCLAGYIDTDFDDRAAEVLADSPSIAGLEELQLWNCNLRTAGARAIARSPHLAALRSLALGGGHGHTQNEIGAEGCAALAETSALPRLESIELGFNHVGDSGWRCFVDSGKLVRLVEISLVGCQFSDASIVPMFTKTPRLDALTHLNLSFNKLGPASAKALASARLPSLRTLTLTGNSIGDRGVAALADAPWIAQLDELVLERIGMTDTGVEALLQSPHLDGACRIHCTDQGGHLSAESLSRLQERFGDRIRPSWPSLRTPHH